MYPLLFIMTDGLIDWLTDWLIDWLTDWVLFVFSRDVSPYDFLIIYVEQHHASW